MEVNLAKFNIKFNKNSTNLNKKLNLIRILIKSTGLKHNIKG